jgi:omega-hydroxy-beta-dihydromenaquinone-9 sulfotransferase
MTTEQKELVRSPESRPLPRPSSACGETPRIFVRHTTRHRAKPFVAVPTCLKHRWSLGNNYLAGITAGDWHRLLRENRFEVDSAYWHRATFITLTSWMNSAYRRKEENLFDASVAKAKIEAPLFILGHWRTGTTHLHNLLAQDTDQFAYANTYQVVNPHTFLCTEEANTRRFARLVPPKRPMDNMALSFQAPQEDEFAPCLMSLRSLYLGISFARREQHYSRYLTFRDVPREELEEWKAAFTWFLKKLTFKYRRPLVLKSPPHTARIRLLLEMFPDARFVHIHRNPYSVFQSSRHYFDTATWYTYLQRPDVTGIDDRILRRYNVLFDAFFADRSLIADGRFHELSFEALERDPVGEMRELYARLGLSGFEKFSPKLQRYVDSLSNYRKNQFIELDPGMRQKIATTWERSFEEWQYPS